MRLILVLLSVWVTVTTASTVHYVPASSKLYVVKSPSTTRQYHEQDSKGFYSYGYSGDTSAKAEYKARDGSSKGFYSYVDADGKLQTVKYEAGRRKGFKAAATNLPRAPVDRNAAPTPVKDTPEVQRAKQAHFEAYREAELRAALSTDTERNESAEEAVGQQLIEEQVEAALLQNAREELLALMTKSEAREEGANGDRGTHADMVSGGSDGTDTENVDTDEFMDANADNETDDIDDGGTGADANAIEDETKSRMTTYTVTEQLQEGELPQLRTIYSLEDDKSSSILKLAELSQKSVSFLEPKIATVLPTATIETLRVPVNSYFTVLSPKTKYSVVAPTTLVTVPHEQTVRLGKTLPVSVSTTFLSHRLNGKST